MIFYKILLYLEVLSCLSPVSGKFPKSFILQKPHCNHTYPNNVVFTDLIKSGGFLFKKIKIKNTLPYNSLIIITTYNSVLFTMEASCVPQRCSNPTLFYLGLYNFRTSLWMVLIHYFQNNWVDHTCTNISKMHGKFKCSNKFQNGSVQLRCFILSRVREG